MSDVFISLILSFATTYFCLPRIIYIAQKKKLFDVPDNRKVHKAPIASLGGIGIFLGVTLACLFSFSFTEARAFQYYMGAALIIFFLGLQDDILTMSPAKKVMGQLVAALIIVYKGKLSITNLHGFAGMHQISAAAGFLLTLLVIIAIVNAFNLIDGVDGLAGTLGLAASVLFGYFFMKNKMYPYAALAFGLSGSLLSFLAFNLQPARIFMGDTGSLLVGLIGSILVIKFIEVAPASSVFQTDAAPAVGFSILMIPLLDTLRVFSIRLWNGQSPFYPDKNHIHHLLLAKGFSHSRITTTLLLANLIVVALVYCFSFMGTTLLILFMNAVYFAGVKFISLLPIKITDPTKAINAKKYTASVN